MPDKPLAIYNGTSGFWTDRTPTWLFLRALGVIYLSAFASAGVQITGLVGARGILPVAYYLRSVSRVYEAPTIFWLNSSDWFLKAVCGAGAILSILLIMGILELSALIGLYVLYLSVCVAGQDFMSFQWDYLLLETGFLSIFARSWLFRWLLFRLMFLSGAVKLMSHDASWRNLTAMQFHYATQPLPTPLAWYAYQLPGWFQRASTGLVLGIELAVPFLIFAPRRLRYFGAACLALLQVLILLTGNYAFFNLLALALILFLFEGPKRASKASMALTVALVMLSACQLSGMFFGYTPRPAAAVLRFVAPFGIVNTYGLFAVMTTQRPEIVVQGSADGEHWLDYEFSFKPGDLRKAPRWVAPYQPRLDWQMWFAALSDVRDSPWFVSFMVRLLEGSPETLRLLAKNPFPVGPPRYVRAQLFEYRFTDTATRRATGNWWTREPRGLYLPPISLQDVRRN